MLESGTCAPASGVRWKRSLGETGVLSPLAEAPCSVGQWLRGRSGLRHRVTCGGRWHPLGPRSRWEHSLAIGILLTRAGG